MGCEAGWCKTSTSSGIFNVAPSLVWLPTEAKEAPSPHEVRLAPQDTNPVFQYLREIFQRLRKWLLSNSKVANTCEDKERREIVPVFKVIFRKIWY